MSNEAILERSIMEKATELEKVAGSLTVSTAATITAALAGGPIAALLPILTATLANQRHKVRVEKALSQIEKDLSEHSNTLQNLSDAQYKFINESIITILHSPDDLKINFLKKGIQQASARDRIDLHQAGLLSRILRDITVEEITFLIECKGNKVIFHEEPKTDCLNIKKLSIDEEKARGLISLGLLTRETEGVSWDGKDVFVFTKISEKLIELVK